MTGHDSALPRELAPGLFWLGNCLHVRGSDPPLHSYNSCYLIQGDDAAMLVETGCAQDLPIIVAQLEGLLARGGPPLRYLFCTHQETPHAAGIGWLLERYGGLELVGDVRDYHLVFPEYADRFRPLAAGEAVDLGGTRLEIHPSVLRDLPTTQWGFETRHRVLFPGDGFAYAHHHAAGHCGRTAEEAHGLPIPEMTALFAEAALYWTRFTDMAPYVERLARFIDDDLGGVDIVAPTHGLPITDLERTMPDVRAGLLLAAPAAGA